MHIQGSAAKKAMHIAICDDNIGDRKQLERLLHREADSRALTTGTLYIDSYGNKDAVLQSPMLYDAFFIDMTSGEINGLDLAALLHSAGVTAPIILCISSVNYRNLFSLTTQKDSHSILFLDKPIKRSELSSMLDLILEMKSSAISTIELRGEKDTRYVTEDDIVSAKAAGNFVHVVLKDNSYIDILSTLQNFYSQLADYSHYAAVSRSTMVNIMYIRKLTYTKITLENGMIISFNPLCYFELKKALQH